MAATTCPICFENVELHSSEPCKHSSCLPCLRRWFEACEVAGQSSPTCPSCRDPVSQDDARFVLSRSYGAARGSTAGQMQNGQDFDDLTQEWLQEAQAKACRHCGAWIVKRDGCDLMQCLCGYRFCWTCDSPGSECSCSPPNHVFWDNILDTFARTKAPRVATSEDLQDLRVFVENHRDQETQAHQKDRQQRRQQRYKEAILNAIERGQWDLASIWYKNGKHCSGGNPPDWSEEIKLHMRHMTREQIERLFPGL